MRVFVYDKNGTKVNEHVNVFHVLMLSEKVEIDMNNGTRIVYDKSKYNISIYQL